MPEQHTQNSTPHNNVPYLQGLAEKHEDGAFLEGLEALQFPGYVQVLARHPPREHHHRQQRDQKQGSEFVQCECNLKHSEQRKCQMQVCTYRLKQMMPTIWVVASRRSTNPYMFLMMLESCWQ